MHDEVVSVTRPGSTIDRVCCPICSCKDTLAQQIRGHRIYRCSACGHFFYPVHNPVEHVTSVYSDQYFSNSSEGYQDYLAEERLQRASAKFYCQLIRRHCMEVGSALDIGAACGFFLDEFQQAGWHGLGVEPNERMREVAKERFQLPMVPSLDDVSERSNLQLVTMIQVISHLIDPVASLKHVHQMLRQDGLLLIETWDRSSLVARLSGSSWHEWNPPSVIQWFSRASLAHVVESIGFSPVASGLPRKSIQIGRAVAMLRHSWQQSLVMRCVTSPLGLIPGRLSIPYLLGDAFWVLLRKK